MNSPSRRDRLRTKSIPAAATACVVSILAMMAPAQDLLRPRISATLVGGARTFATSGDFTNDGLPDLILFGANVGPELVANPGLATSQQLAAAQAIFPGLSGFAAAITQVSAARLDGDPNLDLLFVGADINGSGTTVWTALGNGDGTFQAPQFAFAVSAGLATGTAGFDVFDFDRDGRDDVLEHVRIPITVGGDLMLWRIRMNSWPVFSAGTVFQTTGFGIPAMGDFNGDGVPDFVRAPQNTLGAPFLAVYSVTASGNFVNWPPIGVPAAVQLDDAGRVTVGDVNADGFSDVVFAATAPPLVGPAICFGNAAGLGPAQWTSSVLPPGASLASAQVVDCDGDGISDVLMTTRTPQSPAGGVGPTVDGVSFLRGLGSGVLQAPPHRLAADALVPVGSVTQTAIGDFDSDGDVEIVTIRRTVGAANPTTTLVVFDDHSFDARGCSGGAGLPTLDATTPSLGNLAFEVVVTGAPLRPTVLGLSRASTSGIGCGIGLSLAVPDIILPIGVLGTSTTDGAGRASFPLPIPNLPQLAASYFLQAAIEDPTGTFPAGGASLALTRTRQLLVF